MRYVTATSALGLVLLIGETALAADPITARAGAARIDISKPTGPTPMVRRGLILPANLFDVYAQPVIERPVGVDDIRLGTTLGALWGISPEVHADFQISGFYLPNLVAGTSRVTIAGRVIKTEPLDFGLTFMTMFDPSAPTCIGFVQPGTAAILRPHGLWRIDTGVQLPLFTTPETHLGLRVPLNVFFQISERVHVGSTSALAIADLRDPWSTASIPLGLTAGYSAGPELDFAAFTPFVSWTNFYHPVTGVVDTRSFVAGIIADVAVQVP